MPSLYQRLIDVAQVNESVETELINTKGSLRARMAPYPHEEYFLDDLTRIIHELGRSPPIDVPQVQSAILHSPDYEGNETLRQASEEAQGIQGEHSLTATLDEAMKINKGWRSILPRRKNPEQNRVVDELSALVIEQINELQLLKARGVFYPDNLVTGFAYATPIISAIVYLLDVYSPGEVNVLRDMLLGGLAGLIIGIAIHIEKRTPDVTKNPMERAEFIDKKIRQLSEVSSTTA